MKELTLKELQGEELKILKSVHSFCKDRGIRYSLYGGTQIGAIRHKGFIPWDDDIDVIMPRPDYIRFCEEFTSSTYKLACAEKTHGYMLAFARVYDDNRTVASSTIPWLTEDVGVWIDVFPADGFPSNPHDQRRLYRKVIRLRRKVLLARGARANYSTFSSVAGKIKLLIKRIITLNGSLSSIWLKKLNLCMQTYAFETSPFWASLSNVRGLNERKHHLKNTFSSCELVPFEDMDAYIMNGTDIVLKERYHNYMQLPPESERVPKQDYIHFYWTDNK